MHTFTPLPGDLSPGKITHRFAGAVPGAAVLGALRASVPVAPVTAGTSPDAELIALCAEFEALTLEASHVWDGCEGPGDGTQDAAEQALSKRQRALLPRMVALRATTPEGFYARARAMMHDGFGHTWDDLLRDHADVNARNWTGIMLAAFMRDAMQRDVAPLFAEIEGALS